ncbi:hypothetical protein [Petrachloros mirabilis]
MKYALGIAALLMHLALPVHAEGPPAFDPDQPFNEAMERYALESLFGRALEELEDHFDISGNLDFDEAGGTRNRWLQFRFYPDGKSRSDQYVAAEGWFGPSQESGRQEFHFRFSVPKSPPSPRYENVL